MNVRTSIICLAGILLFGCGREPGPVVDSQGSKFSEVPLSGAALGRCTLHGSTNLMWEVKSNEPGLHDWRNSYSWFDPDESFGELDYRGTPDGGDCAGSDCDTWDFVRAVNTQGYCGFHDWRLPSRDELMSISDLGKADTPPTIDTKYFPYAQAEEYWSANDYSFQYNAAWVWSFRHGHDRVDWKKSPKFLRLVRGKAERLTPVKE